MSNLPAIPTTTAIEGLEDFDTSTDMVMPTLSINHKEGKLVDGLSGERFDAVEVVLLGLIKQRILWDAEMSEDGAAPFCKSYDYTSGTPDQKNPSRFPWSASGFGMADYLVEDGTTPLPCDKCALKEWGSHPKNDTPWCTEQHTFALALPGAGFSPAILTLQRTGIKASKSYLTSFVRQQMPLFVVTTNVSLSLQKRGTVDYAVPILGRGTPTDESMHEEFATSYRRIRDHLTTPPVPVEDDAPTPVTVNSKPTAAAALDDDEMPF